MKTFFRYRNLIISVLILSVFISLGLVYQYGEHKLEITDAYPLSEGWKSSLVCVAA